MHRAGLIVHEVLTTLRDAVRPGLTTMDLEKLAEEKIAGRPGKAAFKGYRDYPCVLCTSVNSEIVHGIPSPKRKLREGDIVSIDFGMEVDGYYADSAVTVPVGEISPALQKLLDVTRESLDRAIEKMRAGNRLGDVGSPGPDWGGETGWAMSVTRCRAGWSRTATRWCGNLSGTASAPECTTSPTCRTTATQA